MVKSSLSNMTAYHADPQDQYKSNIKENIKKYICISTVSTHITPWDLELAKFVEQLQVLRHGVNRVCWCEESLGFCSKNRRQFGDAGAEERLHELLHEIPAVPWNHTRTVLHLREHTQS